MIKIVKSSDIKEIKNLQKKLSVDEGMVTPSSVALTKKIFGKVLTPNEVVKRICEDVKKYSDDAILKYSRLLDGVRFKQKSDFKVSFYEMKKAWENTDKLFKDSLSKAAKNILYYQKKILTKSKEISVEKDLKIYLKYIPLQRVGVYVPSGSAPLSSSILMNVLPAQAAGVKDIIVCTPPSKDGSVNKFILACCFFCNVKSLFKIGGVTAVAGMAYGTEIIPKVDKIVGPGNLFVSLAKKRVFGLVDIDLIAGPSEIVIIADDSAKSEFIAADLIAQAEHYPGAAILLTDSITLAKKVNEDIKRFLPQLSRSPQIKEDLKKYSLIVVCKNISEACKISNDIAPEHLSLQTKKTDKVINSVDNAGAVFIGPWSPVALGDYFAGPSHTLPTGGTSRFFSGLNSNQFLKSVAFIKSNSEYIKRYAKYIENLAESEGLTGHKFSVYLRK